MALLFRPPILLDLSSRRIVAASFNRSAILSSTALSAGPIVAPGSPGIFDIFDAPVKLRDGNHSSEQLKAHSSLSTMRATPRVVPSHSKYLYGDAMGLPWSLPPPVTFDGPATPPHMSPSILDKRRLQRQKFSPMSRGVHVSSTASSSTLASRSPPLCQLFDGPSRLIRYPYPTLRNERSSFTYVSLALCLSGTLGWLVFMDNFDLRQ